jgi:hypothetical protein
MFNQAVHSQDIQQEEDSSDERDVASSLALRRERSLEETLAIQWVWPYGCASKDPPVLLRGPLIASDISGAQMHELIPLLAVQLGLKKSGGFRLLGTHLDRRCEVGNYFATPCTAWNMQGTLMWALWTCGLKQ